MPKIDDNLAHPCDRVATAALFLWFLAVGGFIVYRLYMLAVGQ
jgi:hypothetical protein